MHSMGAAFFNKGHLDDFLVIANAKGLYNGGRVGKKADNNSIVE